MTPHFGFNPDPDPDLDHTSVHAAVTQAFVRCDVATTQYNRQLLDGIDELAVARGLPRLTDECGIAMMLRDALRFDPVDVANVTDFASPLTEVALSWAFDRIALAKVLDDHINADHAEYVSVSLAVTASNRITHLHDQASAGITEFENAMSAYIDAQSVSGSLMRLIRRLM